jgi:hypothetical protein
LGLRGQLGPAQLAQLELLEGLDLPAQPARLELV